MSEDVDTCENCGDVGCAECTDAADWEPAQDDDPDTGTIIDGLKAEVARLRERLAQAERERDEARDWVQEYERPNRWPEGSQMRHLQDMLLVLKIEKRKATAYADDLAQAQRDLAAERGHIRQLLAVLQQIADSEVDWQMRGLAIASLAASGEDKA